MAFRGCSVSGQRLLRWGHSSNVTVAASPDVTAKGDGNHQPPSVDVFATSARPGDRFRQGERRRHVENAVSGSFSTSLNCRRVPVDPYPTSYRAVQRPCDMPIGGQVLGPVETACRPRADWSEVPAMLQHDRDNAEEFWFQKSYSR